MQGSSATMSDVAVAPSTATDAAEMLRVDNVTLTFGGVKAISDISFNINEGEIRAIIGPNGAGKTSMLNVINGFYHPQMGTITWRGKQRRRMKPHEAAASGIARTFQNVALFKGMSTLDNIMSGRSLRMKRNFFWQRNRKPASCRGNYRLSGNCPHSSAAGWQVAVWVAKTCGVGPCFGYAA